MSKFEKWKLIINECKSSTLTQTAFCQQEGIKLSTLHYWIRIVKKSAEPASLISKENTSDRFIKIPTVSTPFPENNQKADISIGCVNVVIPACHVAALLISLHQAGVLHDQA
ncbi:hypothetical protein A8139_20570 [Marinomonas primoryensis]|uniref:Transposase n=2 Tax=Marinomonas primoryensis TaxID=178399 RepID=A0A2Z4PN73_9GAMM|nr:hypothetical protein [Marinomonas primoryensis]AWX99060.1 hypothetical protein A8139_02885 [Marinomonas primoryensis]AWX99347.1 hypothetical protein A8139_04505 [Marinomonas primoryensis]AWX99676.1 hypothetical protein A8139_06440 [Marinomonas primoryensis]AWX99679.1 hypothetical protein A8139_06455 [Marinomonas primoryensis]AWX99697.1 hypothetical protein A8139_06550 [Marinomonas primoryensis]